MSPPIRLIVLAFGLWGCGGPDLQLVPKTVTLATREQLDQGRAKPNSYIVMFRGEQGSTVRRFASFAAEYDHHVTRLGAGLLTDPRVASTRFLTGMNLANPRDPAAREALAPPPGLRLAWTQDDLPEVPGSLMAVDFADEAAAAATLGEWESRGLIWYAEPNFYSKISDPPNYSTQGNQAYQTLAAWWHKSINLYAALDSLAQRAASGTAVTSPVIAVMDSGVDVQNQNLAGHIWQTDALGARGCSNDTYGCDTTVAQKGNLGNGGVNPYLTTDFGQACPYDGSSTATETQQEQNGTCGHGTHVAGIIAATANGTGADGVGGVCPVCRIMPIKIIANGKASDDAILAAFKYLTRFGDFVHVINSSFGKYDRSRSVSLLVTELSKQMLVVGAAGNEDSMIRSYPAGFPEAIAVAALGQDDGKALYSNFGSWVSVSAPGGDAGRGLPQIHSTVPGTDGRGDKQGTSMATPVVTGIVGLILSVDPTRSVQGIRDSLINTANPRIYGPDINNGTNLQWYYPQYAGDSYHTPLLGSGVVDAAAAIDGTATTGLLVPGVNSTVSRDCAVVGGGRRGGAPWTALPLLMLPVSVAVRRRTGLS